MLFINTGQENRMFNIMSTYEFMSKYKVITIVRKLYGEQLTTLSDAPHSGSRLL